MLKPVISLVLLVFLLFSPMQIYLVHSGTTFLHVNNVTLFNNMEFVVKVNSESIWHCKSVQDSFVPLCAQCLFPNNCLSM